MKTIILTPKFWLGFALLAVGATAQEQPPSSETKAPPPESAPADVAAAKKEAGLRFNFRGAPLEMVLNYLSEAAGFVIVLETPVRGSVDMWSAQPVTKEEAVQLLNLALNKNGFTATTQGRNLIIASKDEAKKRNIPIRTGNDPKEIPMTAELVMQIIPLRHIDAMQVSRDLATLIPSSSTITANQDSNSLVVTDTQINIRHVVELVAALDTSVESVTAMKVFRLTNADAVEMAQLLTSIFQTPNTNTGARTAAAMPFNPAAMMGMGAMQNAAANMMRNRAMQGGSRSTGTQDRRPVVVTAVADPRTSSVIVTATKNIMPQIAEIVAQLDADAASQQKVFVYTMENANVRQVETALKNIFPSSNNRSTNTNQNDPLTTRAANTQQQSNSSLSGNSSANRLRR